MVFAAAVITSLVCLWLRNDNGRQEWLSEFVADKMNGACDYDSDGQTVGGTPSQSSVRLVMHSLVFW